MAADEAAAGEAAAATAEAAALRRSQSTALFIAEALALAAAAALASALSLALAAAARLGLVKGAEADHQGLTTGRKRRSCRRKTGGGGVGKLGWGESSVAAAAATAAKIMEVQWKRWIRTGAAWAVQVAGYTPRAGQRRRNHRSGDTGEDGGSSTARLDLAWRRS